MFDFLRKLFGFDKDTMKAAGVQIEQAPYKLEPVNLPEGNAHKAFPTAVNDQITDSVTTAQPAWHTAPAEGSSLAKNALDVNQDGKVNFDDVKAAVKNTKVRAKKVADVNKDGKVTKADAVAAVKKAAPRGRKPAAKV